MQNWTVRAGRRRRRGGHDALVFPEVSRKKTAARVRTPKNRFILSQPAQSERSVASFFDVCVLTAGLAKVARLATESEKLRSGQWLLGTRP